MYIDNTRLGGFYVHLAMQLLILVDSFVDSAT